MERLQIIIEWLPHSKASVLLNPCQISKLIHKTGISNRSLIYIDHFSQWHHPTQNQRPTCLTIRDAPNLERDIVRGEFHPPHIRSENPIQCPSSLHEDNGSTKVWGPPPMPSSKYDPCQTDTFKLQCNEGQSIEDNHKDTWSLPEIMWPLRSTLESV